MGVKTAEIILETTKPVDFGILFDIDGVIARGSTPLRPAQKMIKSLMDENKNPLVPFAFVTNACNTQQKKVDQINKWLDIEVSASQVIHAQSPLSVFKSLHSKHVLISGQGPVQQIAADLGFTNTCTVEDVALHYPFLDVVDHDNRTRLASGDDFHDIEFPQVEAIVMFGEPKRWESSLQVMIDLLMTNGKPTQAPEKHAPKQLLPVIICNADLVFMAEACMPRFGHGAFITCLEALYKKITSRDLQYQALVGKPGELTFRYAEHVVNTRAKEMGLPPIKKLYVVGDNPEVDIFGANLYNEFIRSGSSSERVPRSRRIPIEASFLAPTVNCCRGVLVETGVYRPDAASRGCKPYHGHRDFEFISQLVTPWQTERDVDAAVAAILSEEGWK